MNSNTENQQNKNRNCLLARLIPHMMRDGFQALRMDDIAKYMNVSRATLYKNFSSKKDVIEGIIRIVIDYIEMLEERSPEDNEISFGIWFQRLFGQTVALVGNMTDVFIKDLQMEYPDVYAQLKNVLTIRKQQILEFYRDGKNRGIFNPINENFILLQDDILLREIVNPKYLLNNQVSIRRVLHDYYQFQKFQLFKAEKLLMLDDFQIEPFIEHFVEKYTRIFGIEDQS